MIQSCATVNDFKVLPHAHEHRAITYLNLSHLLMIVKVFQFLEIRQLFKVKIISL